MFDNKKEITSVTAGKRSWSVIEKKKKKERKKAEHMSINLFTQGV